MGYGPIVRVELSVDGGTTWQETALSQPPSPCAATPWKLLWRPERPGPYVLVSRATYAFGNAQLWRPVWNWLGYGNNGVQRAGARPGLDLLLSFLPLVVP